MRCGLIDLGLVNYELAQDIQSNKLREIKAGLKDAALILCEFFPVYTLGRSGDGSNLLVSRDFLKKSGIGYRQSERGGDITFHSPGQLVIYPVFNLAFLKKDLNWYLRSLEAIIINLLSEYGVNGCRKAGYTGVWTQMGKIASIGIAVSRWVTSHGLSLNVNNDLSYFDLINPCGIRDCRMASIYEETGGKIDMRGLKGKAIAQFKARFGLTLYAEAVKTAALA
ncbi:MAG: lipoyl(octanoyl) transferase LipB [Candidatus Omnitrophica bacterium]|nr:lipoyl(octanoyl) transferase LipB [Candidatus Omnitrophota bacterium]